MDDNAAEKRRRATERMREWRSRNQSKWNAYMADYRKRNRERLTAHRRENILQVKAWKHQYLGRKYNAVGKYTAAEFRAAIALYDGKCAYCVNPPPVGQRLEADHAIPLSRGGSNSIENILPACHSCNVRKRDRTPEEFKANVLYKRADPIPKVPAGHKKCHVCERFLPFSAYWKDRSHPLGIQSTCKECNYAKHKAYLAVPANRAKRRASARRWYADK